ncbi:MAG: polysaccharide deacetylase family protein [Chloroflexota bacterium]|nr:polysaccharide deacetylase family protein [Dehalococcoidia bacterium]MDW8047704.1 polysaccharide deacetylase family protein [Chloroflexota bacterium]
MGTQRRPTRRAFLAGSVAALAGAAAAAVGLGSWFSGEPAAPPPGSVLVVDDRDPFGRPRILRSLTPSPTPTPTPQPTPTPTPLPTATPTPSPPPRPSWDPNTLASILRAGPGDRPVVALTIDDGWSARDEVLSVLKDLRVRATFFLAGRAIAGDPGFIARALDAGMELANHTWDHYILTDKSFEYVQNDILQLEQFVRDAAPGATTLPYMRPSGGAVNETVVAAAASVGYRVVLWSSSCGDGSQSTTPEQMVANVLASARPGAIILTHFGPRLQAALPAMVEGLRGLGLEPVTLSEVLGQTG